ncbi:MAG: DUF262 domain-containing protein [Thermomicrobiales bacterium]
MARTQEQTTVTFTNVTANAVVTTEWLSTGGTTLVVPVYQRQYRWEIDGCERLLRDLRAVARTDAGQTHFLGSILYTATSSGEDTERMLVDGQQRVTTLMLLIAAIRDTLAGTDEAISGVLHQMLRHPTRAGQTRLRLRRGVSASWLALSSAARCWRWAWRSPTSRTTTTSFSKRSATTPWRSGAACRGWYTWPSHSGSMSTRSRSSRASTPPARRCGTTS